MRKVLAIFAELAIFSLAFLSLAQAGPLVSPLSPYDVVGTKLEITDVSTIPDAGLTKIIADTTSPKVTFQKWNGEVSMGIQYQGIAANTAGVQPFFSKNVEWTQGSQTMQAVPLDATTTMEDGGMEINIILNSAPATNQFNFTISGANNLDFFYQAPLWQEAGLKAPTKDCTDTDCTTAEETSQRPDNVVGSYAVYYKDRANHIEGQTNYATGKAYQIFRPQVSDANGATTWADLSYANGTLTVSVPQSFLNSAVYPVKVDPTFGYTTAGASQVFNASNGFASSKFTSLEPGNVTSITFSSSGGTTNEVAIYNDSAGSVGTLLVGDTVGVTPPAIQSWSTVSISTTVSAATYHLAWNTNGFSHFYYDAGAANQTLYATMTFGTWTDNPGSPNQARKHSIYATYVSTTTIYIKQVILLSNPCVAQTWSVPSDFNVNDNLVEIIGAGGDGDSTNAAAHGAGGGAGAFASTTNMNITGSVSYMLGMHSTTTAGSNCNETFFNGTASTSATVSAAFGRPGSGSTAGAGGTTAWSTLGRFAGGKGGAGGAALQRPGGGGGGAASVYGAGLVGGASNATDGGSGAGGGGTGGVSVATAGVVSGNATAAGSAGGIGTQGNAGGAGATTASVAAGNGTNGSGAGGGCMAIGCGSAGSGGGNSSTLSMWQSGYGSGGGGGGGGATTTATTGVNGGGGGTYGGGGGGAGSGSTTVGSGGTGGQGIIVITYTPVTPQKTVVLNSTTGGLQTWTVPADFSSTNTVICIGAGGDGATSGTGSTGKAGGGGGAFASSTNLTLSGSISYQIGLHGTTTSGAATTSTLTMFNETFFNSTASSSASISCAPGEPATSTASIAPGGTVANSTGTTKFAGGKSGKSSNAAGGGGGGAGGPSGIGAVGAAGGANGGNGGGGGGGADGGTAGTANGDNGGPGGNNSRGYGGTASVPLITQGGNGINSGGGGGAGGGGGSPCTGGLGGEGLLFAVYVGPGGGGGGGGSCNDGGNGGAGGTYGGGGGGGGNDGLGTVVMGVGGTGGRGVIVIIYTPAVTNTSVQPPVFSIHGGTFIIRNQIIIK